MRQEKTLYGKTSIGVVRAAFAIDKNGVVEKSLPKVKPGTDAAKILEYLKRESRKKGAGYSCIRPLFYV